MSRNNIELVLEGYRAFCRGDVEQAFAILDTGVEWHGSEVLEPCASRCEVVSTLAGLFENGFPFELTEAVAVGDHVMLGFRDACGGWARYFAVVEIEDGKVVGIHQFAERLEALEHVSQLSSSAR